MVELPPAYFAFRGAGLDVLVECPEPRISLGVVSAGHVGFPGFMSEVFWRVDGPESAALRWDLALGLQARYAFLDSPSSPYLGVIVGYEWWTVTIDDHRARHENVLLVLGPGYLWRPFDSARWFHLNAQLLLMFNIADDYSHSAGETNYGIRPVTAIPNLTVGASFPW